MASGVQSTVSLWFEESREQMRAVSLFLLGIRDVYGDDCSSCFYCTALDMPPRSMAVHKQARILFRLTTSAQGQVTR